MKITANELYNVARMIENSNNPNLKQKFSAVFQQITTDFCDEQCGKNLELTGEEMDFARSNRKISAVTAYRKRTGKSLLEAKSAVEDWQRENHCY